MPIGIICSASSILVGGIIGAAVGQKLSDKFKANLTLVFSICAMGMGINSIGLMKYMPAVIFSCVAGTAIGMACHLGVWIEKGAQLMQRPISKIFRNQNKELSEEEFLSALVTVIVLFCGSATGIYGSIDSGMTGDHVILISKAILDIFTALVFACNLGVVVSVIAIPQFIIFYILFLAARLIFPLTTPDMIADFKACGGFLLLATGFRMMKVREFPTADMLPAMVIIMPVSWFWANWLMPLL